MRLVAVANSIRTKKAASVAATSGARVGLTAQWSRLSLTYASFAPELY